MNWKVFGASVVAAAMALGFAMNFKALKRYIRISTM
jgi:hypothetical protein